MISLRIISTIILGFYAIACVLAGIAGMREESDKYDGMTMLMWMIFMSFCIVIFTIWVI